MMDDDSNPPGSRPDAAPDGELLLYDFLKHLTSLALLTLGGILIVAGTVDKADVKPIVLIAVLVVVSASGVLSFAGASEIVKKRYTGSTTHNLDFYRKAAPMLLAIGAGMFLSLFADSLY